MASVYHRQIFATVPAIFEFNLTKSAFFTIKGNIFNGLNGFLYALCELPF
ncbi:hypothetical protein ACZ87_03894 [Candidatus Erwinia dacicola]|uniref:Uncharacterized protein n=1 Tax=Candidatus Erwinia dacicola TaxID=252393 RepID=A0A328TBP3_9GAMM|nr:hypothetical protein ACZ87_03894 [Candidatus Erwinia dacicola]